MAVERNPVVTEEEPEPERVPEPDLFTVDEFFALVPEGQKADLIDGVIYMASPDTKRHNLLNGFLYGLLQDYAGEKDLGQVFISRFSFILGERRAPEPDVAFVSSERAAILQERGGMGAPDIAVEIVSRESRTRDYHLKKELYEQSGVREYWLIDPLQSRAEFHRLQEGRYALVPFERNRIFRSQALPGFWLDVEWLFAEPLPNKYRCLEQILAGEPE